MRESFAIRHIFPDPAPQANSDCFFRSYKEHQTTCNVIRYELDDITAREYWSGELVTDRAFRGQDVAKALIQQAIARAQQQQIGELWLYTPEQQAYYQRLGWQSVEQRQIAGEDVTVMVLHLAQ
jgi:GNAT superfamily N-acetyltransferase